MRQQFRKSGAGQEKRNISEVLVPANAMIRQDKDFTNASIHNLVLMTQNTM